MSKRVLVCGGVDYADYRTLCEVLDGIHKGTGISCIIEGGALGADRFARMWARVNNVSYETYEADWQHFRKAAGPMRNIRMLKEGKPDRVVAFPGHKGTTGMVLLARKCYVEVLEIEE